jgi:hypothetical protein
MSAPPSPSDYALALAKGEPLPPLRGNPSSKLAPTPAAKALIDVLWAAHDTPGMPPLHVLLANDAMRAAMRVGMRQLIKAMVGEPEVPATPAEQMQAQRGVGGCWFAWPGVDTSSAASTVIYAHGGEPCATVGQGDPCLEMRRTERAGRGDLYEDRPGPQMQTVPIGSTGRSALPTHQPLSELRVQAACVQATR